jgi:hypothetical protein
MHTCALLLLHCMHQLTAISAGVMHAPSADRPALSRQHSGPYMCCCCGLLQLGIPFPCNAVGSQCVLRMLYLALYPCCGGGCLVSEQGALQPLQQVLAGALAQCLYICLWSLQCACAAWVDSWPRPGFSSSNGMLAGCWQPCSSMYR